MKILVLGSSGLLGNTLFRVLSRDFKAEVFGSIRDKNNLTLFLPKKSLFHFDANDQLSCERLLINLMPDIIINCIGLTKHLKEFNDPVKVIKLNAIFPHDLYKIAHSIGSRLIHISTDCVFSGTRGMYSEVDYTDPIDLYGRSKILGEIDQDDAITIRTSVIGHELKSSHGLLEWFLSQEEKCKGYKNAVFSGVTTVFFAEIIRDHVIPNKELSGILNIAGTSINKYDLLKIIAKVYNKNIEIEPDVNVIINRSLDASKFNLTTGCIIPDWQSLIESMYQFNNEEKNVQK